MSQVTVARQSAEGTTLLELVITLVLLGLIAGIGLLNLRALEHRESPALVLRHCRALAVRTGHPQSLVLDTLELLCLPDGGVAGAGLDQLVGRVR